VSKSWALFLILTVFVAGCAHRGAVRVECDGPLRPINRPVPVPSTEAPVSVAPAGSKSPAHDELRP